MKLENSEPQIRRIPILILLLLSNLLVSVTTLAQIPVHEEFFHKPIFETEAYRILRVALNPGDTSDFHLHNTPILFISLKETQMYLADLGVEPELTTLPNGWIGSKNYNADDYLIHQIAPRMGDSLLVIAFQLKVDVLLSKTSSDSTVFDFQENGFTVCSRKDIGSYFESNSIPLIVKSGEISIGGKRYKRGNLISKEVYLKIHANTPPNHLTYWEVGFAPIHE